MRSILVWNLIEKDNFKNFLFSSSSSFDQLDALRQCLWMKLILLVSSGACGWLFQHFEVPLVNSRMSNNWYKDIHMNNIWKPLFLISRHFNASKNFTSKNPHFETGFRNPRFRFEVFLQPLGEMWICCTNKGVYNWSRYSRHVWARITREAWREHSQHK